MTSSELRSIIGQLRIDHMTGKISDEQLTERYREIDFTLAADDDGNLENLKNIVNGWLNQ